MTQEEFEALSHHCAAKAADATWWALLPFNERMTTDECAALIDALNDVIAPVLADYVTIAPAVDMTKLAAALGLRPHMLVAPAKAAPCPTWDKRKGVFIVPTDWPARDDLALTTGGVDD